jgi:class 3 adenylate cyclase
VPKLIGFRAGGARVAAIVEDMPKLTPSQRERLPDSAFAYIDQRGRRRLPINDEAHVRNALARFNQVSFPDEDSRERARNRLLNAAKKYGIVPVGFITGQFRTERAHAAAGRLVIELGKEGAPGELEQRLRKVLGDRTLSVLHWSEAAGTYLDSAGKPVALPDEDEGRGVTLLERGGRPMTAIVHDPAVLKDPGLVDTVLGAVRFVVEKERLRGEMAARSTDAATLPTGFVTFLLTDIEGSTGILTKLGDRYAGLLRDVRSIIRRSVLSAGGREVDCRADEFFAVFERVTASLDAAAALQRALNERSWPDDLECRVRAGIHSGRPTLTDTGYIGLSVHTAARVCSAAYGGQIVLSAATKKGLDGGLPAGTRLKRLGRHRLAGLSGLQSLYQLEAEGLPSDFPAPRTQVAAEGPN